MATLRTKLSMGLAVGFVCALFMIASGILDGSFRRNSYYLLQGGPLAVDDGALLSHGSSDSEQSLSQQVGDDTPSNIRRDEIVQMAYPPESQKPSLSQQVGDDSPSNIRRDEIVQMAYPPESQKPSLSPGDLLEVMDLTDDLMSVSKVNASLSRSMLGVWPYWSPILSRSDLLPGAINAMEEGLLFWKEAINSLLDEVKKENNAAGAPSPGAADAVKWSPYSVSSLNSSELSRDDFVLEIPRGLVVDSSITIVGIPRGVVGDFRINLFGERLPGEKTPPIFLHYNLRLHGDLLTNNSVIVQNSWTLAKDWEEEERCPPLRGKEDHRTVDGLSKCIDQVGQSTKERRVGEGKWPVGAGRGSKAWFPFVEGFPFSATLRVGLEGFHMTVNGRHITSYAYRQNLEPWLVSGIQVKGDIQISSLMVNGLPYVEDLDRVIDLEFLKAPSLPVDSNLTMLIGVFSSSNNFDERMAIRRSWMQAKEVKSGKVAVRFFVGLHKTKQVNKELWTEATTYGDVQLMPFVDYYHLLTLKTLAVCILGTKVLHADFVMKTDDDTFVRIDEVLSSVTTAKRKSSILYGRMEFEEPPDRTMDETWFVSVEEFPDAVYPPWAHGPGYIISGDIATFVVHSHQQGKLKNFKLEDVAMGIWIEQFRNQTGSKVDFINNDHFVHTGCDDGFIIAHYRTPQQMICMFERLLHESPSCC